ncbi:unnamed protein product, partial [Allacma fusca]
MHVGAFNTGGLLLIEMKNLYVQYYGAWVTHEVRRKVTSFANLVLKKIKIRGLNYYTGNVRFRFSQRWMYP